MTPLTGTFEIDLAAPDPGPVITVQPPVYEAKVIRVRHDNERETERLERELNDLGAAGWYPSGGVGDILILSRLKSAPKPGPATKVTVTWGAPQPVPKG
jgi:hypothetical protein